MEIIELLESNGINIEQNKFLLGKEYNELLCKINYLKEKDLPIVVNGKIHEIFYLNYKKIEKKYNISKDELLNYLDNHKALVKKI